MSIVSLASVEAISASYGPVIPALRPSEYTAALIQALRDRSPWVRGSNALEVGSGSGVVLAAMAELGAASLCGVDIEETAVGVGRWLLHRLGYGARLEMLQGDMWRPVAGRRFDVIAANLPQFPMEPAPHGGRLPSWSSGGLGGRRLLDRLVEGLAEHLAPGGRAIITHNGFVDLERSRAMLARDGLSLRIATTLLVSLPDEKVDLMTPTILRTEEGRTIHRYGPYVFGEMHMVEIGAAAALG